MNAQLERLESLCKGLRLEALPTEEIYSRLTDDMTPLCALIEFLDIRTNTSRKRPPPRGSGTRVSPG